MIAGCWRAVSNCPDRRQTSTRTFACVICQKDEIVAEATTRARRDGDVTRHAEIMAISDAQRKLGTSNLSKCSIYSTVEPCAMCSYCIRETGIGRVLYCLPSPLMGGHSRWNILGDLELSKELPEVFGRPPAIVDGLLEGEAAAAWREWHPLDWAMLRHRKVIGSSNQVGVATPVKNRTWSGLLSWLLPRKIPPARTGDGSGAGKTKNSENHPSIRIRSPQTRLRAPACTKWPTLREEHDMASYFRAHSRRCASLG